MPSKHVRLRRCGSNRSPLLMAAAMASIPLTAAEIHAATLSLAGPPASASPAIAAPDVVSATDVNLVVDVGTGDVSLLNDLGSPTLVTGYDIKVIDASTDTLLVGNPADVSKGTGAKNLAPRTRTAPYTKELLLAETNASSPNYNSSAAALGNNPFAWQVAQDGYNTQTSAFGLAESYASSGTSDAITIPGGHLVDLGTIFNTLASQNDLQFTWTPATSSGGNYTGAPYTGIVDYAGGGIPEPGALGMLGLAGVTMVRTRRKARKPDRGT